MQASEEGGPQGSQPAAHQAYDERLAAALQLLEECGEAPHSPAAMPAAPPVAAAALPPNDPAQL